MAGMHGMHLVVLHFIFIGLLHTASVSAARARILIYSATEQFRHDSIPTAINTLKAKGASIDTEFIATEDRAQFTDNILAGFDALVFLSTTGEVLDDSGKAAFQTYLNRGGNFVGIHSASDTLRNTTCYAKELGALFDYHPVLQNFTVDVLDASHPTVSMLPAEWTVSDEPYNFDSDPRSVGAIVVLAANESSYTDTGVRHDQGSPHPIAWYQEHGAGAGVQEGGVAGRSFYTSLGHLNETWQNDLFMGHILGGISWVLQANTTKAFNTSALVGNQADSTVSSTAVSQSLQPSNSASAQPGGTQTSSASSSHTIKIGVDIIMATYLVNLLAKFIEST